LHAVEKGWIVLIGATTKIQVLKWFRFISRSQVYVLKALSYEKLEELIDIASERYNKDEGQILKFLKKKLLYNIPEEMPES
jgi:putative ATPase